MSTPTRWSGRLLPGGAPRLADRARRRFAAFLCFALLAALAGGVACGRKNGPLTPGVTGGTPFSDGIWYGTFTTTVVAGDPGCTGSTFVDSFTVMMGIPDHLVVPNCTFTRVGNTFAQAGRDTLENSPTCLVIQTFNGRGEVTGNHFSGTWTMTFTKQGSCIPWPFPSCTWSVTGQGQRVPGSAAAARRRPAGAAPARNPGR